MFNLKKYSQQTNISLYGINRAIGRDDVIFLKKYKNDIYHFFKNNINMPKVMDSFADFIIFLKPIDKEKFIEVIKNISTENYYPFFAVFKHLDNSIENNIFALAFNTYFGKMRRDEVIKILVNVANTYQNYKFLDKLTESLNKEYRIWNEEDFRIAESYGTINNLFNFIDFTPDAITAMMRGQNKISYITSFLSLGRCNEVPQDLLNDKEILLTCFHAFYSKESLDCIPKHILEDRDFINKLFSKSHNKLEILIYIINSYPIDLDYFAKLFEGVLEKIDIGWSSASNSELDNLLLNYMDKNNIKIDQLLSNKIMFDYFAKNFHNWISFIDADSQNPEELKKALYNGNSQSLSIPENYTKQKLLSAKNKEEIFNISNQILQLKNSPDKQKANNQIGKLLSILKTKFNINQPILNDEELTKFINSGNKSFPHSFVTKEKEWNGGQQFINDKEDQVFLIYPDYNFLKEIEADKDLKNLFASYSYSHFKEITKPLGWALVHKLNPETWVINQIQSDVFSDLKHKLDQAQEDYSITPEELEIIANEKGEYLILKHIKYNLRDLYQKLLEDRRIFITFSDLKDRDIDWDKSKEDNYTWLNSILNKSFSSILSTISDMNFRHSDNYSREQATNLQNKIGYLLKEWPLIVFHNVWQKAKSQGVKHLYFNTPNTVAGGLSPEAKNIYYNSLPKSLGFEKKKTNLRNKPRDIENDELVPYDEEFWYRSANINKFRYRRASKFLFTLAKGD